MTIKEDLKKRILSKIEEGYNEGGRMVEMGEVALYPDPAPSADPTVHGSGKVLQVDSDLLRDLLNWSISADAGSIDAVVAKAEEMGASAPLTPAQLVDLTATAHTADPSNPSVACGAQPDASGITSPVVPAGPVGPLSPVMASFQRRGKKVQEGFMPNNAAVVMAANSAAIKESSTLSSSFYMNQNGGKKMPNPTLTSKPTMDSSNKSWKDVKADLQSKGEVVPNGESAIAEDDVIDSDNEVITNPSEMGKKNPGIDAHGGQQLPKSTRPIGKLNDPANMGGDGLEEDGIEDGSGVEGIASAIADGLSDGIAGDGIETGPEVTVLPGEGIPQIDDGAVPVDGGEGLVGQVAALNARVAELEALLSGSTGAEVDVEVGADVGGDVGGDVGAEVAVDGEEEDELAIDGDNAEDESEEDFGDDSEEDDSEEDDSEEKEDDSKAGEDDDTKLLLGDEGEKKK